MKLKRFVVKKRANGSKQLKIDSFKQEKKSPLRIFSKIGKAIGYLFSAILTFVLICFVTGVIVGCSFAIYVSNYIDPTMDESLLVTATGDQTTKIYYYEFTDRANRIGTAVELEDARIYGTENSLWASYDDIPTYLREAFVSIEDERFWTHDGVDWKRTAGAVLEFVFGNSSYGGSTITQQLIKNVTGNNEATIQRKVQEILSALNLEKTKGKVEIIELYLNIVPLSQGCIGVRSAAKTYFDKQSSRQSMIPYRIPRRISPDARRFCGRCSSLTRSRRENMMQRSLKIWCLQITAHPPSRQ